MKLFRMAAPAGAVVAIAVVVAGCGGGSSSSSPAASAGAGYGAAAPATAAVPKAAGGTTVAVQQTKLGTVLAGPTGRTLYLFEADKDGKSACSGGCASIWPPLTTTAAPKAGTGALSAKLGTIAGPGGKMQVTYAGHPLYYYAADGKPGDTTGQGLNQFGAEWYVLAPSGSKIDEG
jgi:predicted lipoprotein with Yx(FWY)xxD motif